MRACFGGARSAVLRCALRLRRTASRKGPDRGNNAESGLGIGVDVAKGWCVSRQAYCTAQCTRKKEKAQVQGWTPSARWISVGKRKLCFVGVKKWSPVFDDGVTWGSALTKSVPGARKSLIDFGPGYLSGGAELLPRRWPQRLGKKPGRRRGKPGKPGGYCTTCLSRFVYKERKKKVNRIQHYASWEYPVGKAA